ADCRGDHFDHRGYCNPKPHPLQDGGERGFGGRLPAYNEHGRSDLSEYVSWHVRDDIFSGPWRASVRDSCCRRRLLDRQPVGERNHGRYCKERLCLPRHPGRGGHRYLYYRGRTSHPGSNRHTWILLRPEPGSVLRKSGRERCPWRYLHDNERHASLILNFARLKSYRGWEEWAARPAPFLFASRRSVAQLV